MIRAVLSIIYTSFLVFDANATGCQDFARETQAAIGTPVILLRRYELEASDRLKGLDSRPFNLLRDAATKATASIADPAALAHEDEMNACWTRPARSLCAKAGALLVGLLEKLVANGKSDDDKAAYAAAIGRCEYALDLKPLKSTLRGTD